MDGAVDTDHVIVGVRMGSIWPLVADVDGTAAMAALALSTALHSFLILKGALSVH